MKYAFLSFFLLASWPAQADNRIKLAIIDTGINLTPALAPYLCTEGSQDFTGYGLDDMVGHGTAVAELAVEGLSSSRFCLLVYKWMQWGGDRNSERRVIGAIKAAVRAHARFINMSLAGPGANPEEQIALQDALSSGTTVVVAAGNERCNLSGECDVYPACYPIKHPRFHVVANSTKGGNTNYGGPVTDWAIGTAVIRGRTVYGTSFSSPRILNKLARELQ